eukprot:SAG31_NODE_28401_length_410_cov_2.000000_2_plen_91_part_01
MAHIITIHFGDFSGWLGSFGIIDGWPMMPKMAAGISKAYGLDMLTHASWFPITVAAAVGSAEKNSPIARVSSGGRVGVQRRAPVLELVTVP